MESGRPESGEKMGQEGEKASAERGGGVNVLHHIVEPWGGIGCAIPPHALMCATRSQSAKRRLTAIGTHQVPMYERNALACTAC